MSSSSSPFPALKPAPLDSTVSALVASDAARIIVDGSIDPTRDYINHFLPDEILLIILEGYYNKLSLFQYHAYRLQRAVCRRWRAIDAGSTMYAATSQKEAASLAKCLRTHEGRAKTVRSVLVHNDELGNGWITYMHSLVDLLQFIPRLRAFSLVSVSYVPSLEGALLRELHNHVHLEAFACAGIGLGQEDVASLFAAWTRLNSLEIEWSTGYWSPGYEFLAPSTLSHLRLPWTYNDDSRLRMLTQVWISSTPPVNLTSLELFHRGWRSLRNSSFTDLFLTPLPHLISFTCEDNLVPGLVEVLKYMPKLQRLSIAGSGYSNFDFLSLVPDLRFLSIRVVRYFCLELIQDLKHQWKRHPLVQIRIHLLPKNTELDDIVVRRFMVTFVEEQDPQCNVIVEF